MEKHIEFFLVSLDNWILWNIHFYSSSQVSLGKHKISNGSRLCKQNKPKNKKQGKPKTHKKHNVIDTPPWTLLNFLPEIIMRRLITDTIFLENSHTLPEIAAIDCVEIAAKDSPIDTSTEFDTNFQKSVAMDGGDVEAGVPLRCCCREHAWILRSHVLHWHRITWYGCYQERSVH